MTSGARYHSIPVNHGRSRRILSSSKTSTGTTVRTMTGPSTSERIPIQAADRSKSSKLAPCTRQLAGRREGSPGRCVLSRRGCRRM